MRAGSLPRLSVEMGLTAVVATQLWHHQFMGGGLAEIDEGFEGISFLWTSLREEYLQRCDRANFDRRTRCQIPELLPGMS